MVAVSTEGSRVDAARSGRRRTGGALRNRGATLREVRGSRTRPLRFPHGRRVIPSGFLGCDPRISRPKLLGVSAERERQDVFAAASGSDARRNLNVRSVSRIAAKPTMTFTVVRVSFMPTLKARSADRDALPRRV